MKHDIASRVACIDMEGVLIPELWPHVADMTGIDELRLTTREMPDYEMLVARRMELLRCHGLRLSDVQTLVANINPLPGATEFLDRLRQEFKVTLVSDAFQEMIEPLWCQLGKPPLYCHHFACDADGFIHSACYTRTHGKHEVIEPLLATGVWTLAVGDAFNDLSMLRMASTGILFRPSAQTAMAAPDIPAAQSYDEVLAFVEQAHCKLMAQSLLRDAPER